MGNDHFLSLQIRENRARRGFADQHVASNIVDELTENHS
jgi:hypothetical protein